MNRIFVARFFKLTFAVMLFLGTLGFLSSCAYKLSNNVDSLPGNVKVIFIPMFRNNSTEALAETYFTDSIRSETLRSGYATIANSEADADAVLIGTVLSVDSITDESVIEAKDTDFLPAETVLSTQAKITVTVELKLKKKGSSEVLWSGEFKQYRSYTPPQFTLPVINSANNLYNSSVRRQTLTILSKEMMQLAFDRMVDNF